jgi:CMP/dCMP kinase
VDLDDEPGLAGLARDLAVEFRGGGAAGPPRAWLAGEDVEDAIRTEECGGDASRVAAHPRVREALLTRQHAFRRRPGLVADGRDMGTVVFPDARCKLFLSASPRERAERRHKQLIEKGIDVRLADLLREIEVRDRRDRERATAPLKPAPEAVVIDTTGLPIEEVLDRARAAVAAAGEGGTDA